MTDRMILADGQRVRRPTVIEGKSRTKQSFRDECDVNTIMGTWRKTGQVAHLAKNPPRYGDFTTADDYLSACNKVLDAQSAFGELPAEIRARMHNSPAELLRFLADPENVEEARKLGLVEPAEEEPAPAPAPEGEPEPAGDPPSGE